MFAGRLGSDPGPAGLLTVSHECSGLGRACLAMRRATFDLVGGLSPQLTVAYNVDLSFKVRHLGLRRVWVPAATAYSLGSHHRAALVPKAERVAVRRRWTAPDLDDYLPSSGAWSAARARVRVPG
jgi:GT2 family glycosyltransferase